MAPTGRLSPGEQVPEDDSCAACRRPSSARLTALTPVVPGSGPVQRERRNPVGQEPRVGGARATDPRLTTRDCADRLGVTPRFIVGEIQDGRLIAHERNRQGHRAIYRIAEIEFAAYIRRHWPSTAVAKEPSASETPRR
jgi:hypothetical protein